MPNKFEKRPEEYIVDVLNRLHADIFKNLKHLRFDITKENKIPTDEDLEAETAHLITSLGKGLKDLVKYTKAYQSHKDETPDLNGTIVESDIDASPYKPLNQTINPAGGGGHGHYMAEGGGTGGEAQIRWGGPLK